MNKGTPERVDGSCSLCYSHHVTHVILIHKNMDNVIQLQWSLHVNLIFCCPFAMSRSLRKKGGGEYEVLRLNVQIIFYSDNIYL